MSESEDNVRFMPLMAFLGRVANIALDQDGRAIHPCMRLWLPRSTPALPLWGSEDAPTWIVMIALDLNGPPGWEALDRLAAMMKRAQDQGLPVLLELCPQEGWESAVTRYVTYRLHGCGDPAVLSEQWHRLYDRWQDETLAVYDPFGR